MCYVLVRYDRITRVYQWQPSGKRSTGRSSKRWMDCTEGKPVYQGVEKLQEDKE